MSSHGLTQFVSGPTHKKCHTLDLLFANNHYFKFDDINPIDFNISDHFPIFFDVPIRPNFVQQTKKQIVYKNFRNVDMSSFANSVSSDLAIAFDTNLNESSFPEILKKYDSVVSEKINLVAPEETRTVSIFHAPRWLDSEYKQARAVRRRLERRWKSSGLPPIKRLILTKGIFVLIWQRINVLFILMT